MKFRRTAILRHVILISALAFSLSGQQSDSQPPVGTRLAEHNAADAATIPPHPVPMFDNLRGEADVIYLIANSSLVFGPDPKGRSEEITFIGPVTVPKWPMKSYGRRTLPDGRQQIDIELTQSDLVGESYILKGPVALGEHPELRSLGTITESREAADRAKGLPLLAQVAQVERPQTPQGNPVPGRTFRLTEDLRSIIAANPDILWDDLVSRDLRRFLQQTDKIRAGTLKPRFQPPVTAQVAEQTFRLAPDVEKMIGQFNAADRNAWAYEATQNVVVGLQSKNALVERNSQRVMPSVIPNDFVVARKVLITTSKGILYNETPVPVRGRLTSIPPVFTAEESNGTGLNVFKGMELPVPLLDQDKNIDGWFYSKSHMAFSVRPQAIDRGQAVAKIRLRSGDRTETVEISGPIEIHHGRTQSDAAGAKETLIEVMILALRGQSELAGGDIMAIESFSDRDKFSKGRIAWQSSSAGDATFDLFMDIYTPSGKISNYDPLPLSGKVNSFSQVSKLEKGSLSIPIVESTGEFSAVSHDPLPLLNEAEKPVLSIESMELHISPRGLKASKL